MGYRSPVEISKEIRAALKNAFPFTKFSVRSSSGSINIHWDNIPSSKVVDEIVKPFASVSYDSHTGEILCGGNLFVFATAEYSKEFRAEVESEMSEYALQENRFVYMREWEEIISRKYAEFLASKKAPKAQPKKEVASVSAIVSVEDNKNNVPSYAINEKLNGIEVTFPEKPSEDILTSLRGMGFRWSPRGFWWAKQTDERLSFVQSLCNVSESENAITEVEETSATPITETAKYSEVVSIESTVNVEEVTNVETISTIDIAEYHAEVIIETSSNIIMANNFKPHKQPLTAQEFAVYVSALSTFLASRSDIVLTPGVLAYIAREKAFSIIIEAITAITETTNNSKSIHTTDNAITETPINSITETSNNSNEFYINSVPIWSITVSAYQAYKKVHQPYICEISPFQMSRMSKRQRSQYFKQRQLEWDASANCKREYTQLIIDAYTRGLFSLNSPNVNDDATTIIKSFQRELLKQAEEQQKASLIQSNQISDISQISINDSVYSPLYGYGRVLKINQKTAILQLDSGSTIKTPIFSLQIKSRIDLLNTMP